MKSSSFISLAGLSVNSIQNGKIPAASRGRLEFLAKTPAKIPFRGDAKLDALLIGAMRDLADGRVISR